MTEQSKTIWRRIGLIAILLPISLAWPYALFGVAFLAWTIFEDLKTPAVPPSPPRLGWHNATADDDGWLDLFCARCESPAEVGFLRAMVTAFDLKPHDGVLKSSTMTLDMQVEVDRYRFDFLANGRQVIEIDGATYHSAPEHVERDRIRDAYSVENGYLVLRIPASVVFNTPDEAIRRVRMALVDTPAFTAPRVVRQKTVGKSFGKKLGSFATFIDEWSARIDLMHDIMGPTIEIQTAFETERRQVEVCVKCAEHDLDIQRMDPVTRKLFDEAMAELEDDGTSSALVDQAFEWPVLKKPDVSVSAEAERCIEARFESLVARRDEWLRGLSHRCREDGGFADALSWHLCKSGYPADKTIEIVGSAHHSHTWFGSSRPILQDRPLPWANNAEVTSGGQVNAKRNTSGPRKGGDWSDDVPF
jgi:very-short-patch-repair endonuclease